MAWQRIIGAVSLAALCACVGTSDTQTGQLSARAGAGTVRAERPDAFVQGTVAPALVARFAPRPVGAGTIDYEVIDDALDLMVFNAGPSLRRRAGRPPTPTGTRFVRGHDSPYRLEGNKVFFSQFDQEVIDAVAEYRASLEAIGAGGKVQSLPRNEQLAYWYNLHNFVVIDEIARRYPVTQPRDIVLGEDGEAFHEAKIVDLGDARLSLRDIREVVYTHWNDPKVMYGFYLGDLGGPSIRDRAYTGEGVSDALGRQAREFVNSLRGVSRGGGSLYVSAFYDEGRPHFFPDWPGDIRAHIQEYADEEVQALLADDRTLRFASYQDDIADMAGGDATSALNDLQSLNRGQVGGVGVPPGVIRMANEYREKLLELRREGYMKGTVTIIDVPTADKDDDVE